MIKKIIWTGLLLSLGISGLVACGAPEQSTSDDGVLSSATLLASSGESHSVPETVVGSYLSEAGDGEILTLNADGTFVSRTVTDMNAENCAVAMTETVAGKYVETEKGVCRLTIESFAIKAEGMEGHPEEIEAYVDLLAGADEELRDMYTRLFEGETITGEEFCGEEEFAKLCETEIVAVIDFENGTFSCQSTEE